MAFIATEIAVPMQDGLGDGMILVIPILLRF